MGAITDIWKSERGLITVTLIAAATVLCGFAIIPVQQWLDYTKWIFVTYVAAKTVTGAVGIVSTNPKPEGLPSIMWQDVLEALARSAEGFTRGAGASQKAAPDPSASPISSVPDPQKAG